MRHEIDRFADLDSPIHRWDERWKLGAAACFLLGLALVRQRLEVAALGPLVALTLLLLSRLPILFVLVRLRGVLALLVFFCVVMPLTGPDPSRLFAGVSWSESGLEMASRLVIKVFAIVVVVMTVFATSPVHRTMAALQRLRLPAVLVQLVYFTYRYVFVFADESARMRQALAARGWSARSGLRRRTFTTIGHFVGNLLVHSTERAERVRDALVARGYDGAFRTTATPRTAASDVIKFALLAGAGVALTAMEFAG